MYGEDMKVVKERGSMYRCISHQLGVVGSVGAGEASGSVDARRRRCVCRRRRQIVECPGVSH
jgi:hypothetical protein